MKTQWITGITLAGTMAGVAAAGGGQEDAMSVLLREVARLRERVAELEGDSATAAEARREEVRSIVADAIADAGTRTSMLQSGMAAGHDGSFFLQSADGNFRLNLEGQLQVRFIASLQDNTADASGDDTVMGFENTLTRLGFSGHVVDPSWTYFIRGGWTGTGSSLLLDAWVAKDLGNGWTVKAGQFKLPTWQEWSISETRQQFVERSVIDARMAQVYGQGVMASYSSDTMRAHVALSDGLRHFNGAWNAQADTGLGYDLATEYALTGRVEWLLGGDWANAADYSGFTGDEATYVLGGGIHYQRDEYGDVNVGDETELIEFNLDANLQFDGANVFAAILWRSVDDDAAVDRDEMAIMVQGGYFLSDDLELIARYEYGDLDGAGGAAGDDLSIYTIGVTRYFNRHGLKWTTDVGFAMDAVDAAWGGASRGWRADAAGEDDQVVIRSQLQMLF
jgi:hypothetical protein